jgi:hypothetical protein
MTNQRNSLRKWLLTACALSLLMGSVYAQNRVLINGFDNAAELAASGKNWINWFGTAFYQVLFDTSDASNNVNSGSMQIQAFFPDSGIGGCCGPQFVVMNNYNGINPPLTGNGGNPSGALATNVQFDVRFDPTSIYNTNAGNWPTIEVGTRGGDFGHQYDFGTFTLSTNQTDWVHISLPIGASANWTNIPNVYFKVYGPSYNGYLKFFVDNIYFTTAPVPIVPPQVALSQASRGLRLVAGPNQYDRTQLVGADTNQSWVGGTYPVTYSFKIGAFDVNPPINEFHTFMIPCLSIGGGVLNAFTDYSTASNNLRLLITGGAAGTPTVVAQIDWKTNLINSNPTNIVAKITNSTFAGTWQIRFTSATDGTLITPSGSSTNFSLPADAAATFANPLAYFIGIQPDPTTAIGEFADMLSVQTTGVASPGVPINTDFTTATSIDTNVWMNASVASAAMKLVTDTTSWWFFCGYPDYGAVAATAPDLQGTAPWKTPAYYTGYDTNLFKATVGFRTYSLLPAASLPTVDGDSNSVKSANAFFRVQSPAPAQ